MSRARFTSVASCVFAESGTGALTALATFGSIVSKRFFVARFAGGKGRVWKARRPDIAEFAVSSADLTAARIVRRFDATELPIFLMDSDRRLPSGKGELAW